MPGTKEIRSKIASVKNTQKITKAMQMVATSKIRRAQERMRRARPYAQKMRNVIGHLTQANPDYRHPFLLTREPQAIGLIAGVVCYASVALKAIFKYGDSLDAFGVHGVGGFLGMGQRDIAVSFDQLKFSDTPIPSTVASSPTAPAGSTTVGSSTTAPASTMARSTADNWYPDHAVMSGTKDQLKAIVERIEKLEEEKKATSDDIRDVYAEAKGNGYDVKARWTEGGQEVERTLHVPLTAGARPAAHSAPFRAPP